MALTLTRWKRCKTERRQSGSDSKIKATERHKRAEIKSRWNIIHDKILAKAIRTDRPSKEITQKG